MLVSNLVKPLKYWKVEFNPYRHTLFNGYCLDLLVLVFSYYLLTLNTKVNDEKSTNEPIEPPMIIQTYSQTTASVSPGPERARRGTLIHWEVLTFQTWDWLGRGPHKRIQHPNPPWWMTGSWAQPRRISCLASAEDSLECTLSLVGPSAIKTFVTRNKRRWKYKYRQLSPQFKWDPGPGYRAERLTITTPRNGWLIIPLEQNQGGSCLQASGRLVCGCPSLDQVG